MGATIVALAIEAEWLAIRARDYGDVWPSWSVALNAYLDAVETVSRRVH